MTRLGLIGAGRWGRIYIQTIAALDDVRLARVASRNPESARLVPRDCQVTSDWRELVRASDLHGVVIATPPALHAEMARAAILANLPVLVEKPFTLNLAQAEDLRALARDRGCLVMVDHTHLFHPAFEELKKQAARLGQVRTIDAEAGNHGPYREDVPVLWDWGPHDVAMCLDLLHELPREVSATREAHERAGKVEAETLRLNLTFGEGLRARIRLSNMIAKTRRFAVHCDDGVLVYDELVPDKLVLHQRVRATALTPAKGMPIAVSPEQPLRRVVKAFVAAIAEGSDRTLSLDLAVEVVAVLERCGKAIAAS